MLFQTPVLISNDRVLEKASSMHFVSSSYDLKGIPLYLKGEFATADT